MELFFWKTGRKCEESIHIQSYIYIYIYNLYECKYISTHKYTVSSFNYSVTISEHTQGLHRTPNPKSPAQDSGIMPVVGPLLYRDLSISLQCGMITPSQYIASTPTPKREYSRKCIQAFTHSSHADNAGSTMWCFLGLHISGPSRLQSPCKRSWRLPRQNSVELTRLGPQQNHAFILLLSSKSTACSFRNGRHEHRMRCAR